MSLTFDHGASAQARLTRLIHIVAHVTEHVFCRLFAMISAEIDRRQTMKLLEFDARDLQDLGVTRSEVAGALVVSPGARPSRILAARRREGRKANREQTLELRAEMLH